MSLSQKLNHDQEPKYPTADMPHCPIVRDGERIECKGARCGWWVLDSERCAVVALAEALDGILTIVSMRAGG